MNAISSIMCIRFLPVVVLRQSFAIVWKTRLAICFFDVESLFVNERNRFARDVFKCSISLTGSIKYRSSRNIFLIETFHVLRSCLLLYYTSPHRTEPYKQVLCNLFMKVFVFPHANENSCINSLFLCMY